MALAGPLTEGPANATYVNVINIHTRGFDELCCKKRRMGSSLGTFSGECGLPAHDLVLASGLDRALGSRVHLLVARRPRAPRLHAMEQTNELLGRTQLRPLARQ